MSWHRRISEVAVNVFAIMVVVLIIIGILVVIGVV